MTQRSGTSSTARVLVTRPAGTWPALVQRFRKAAIEIELASTTAQVEPLDPRPGDEALASLGRYEWLLLTSGRGVRALVLKLAARGRHGLPSGVRVAVIGPATARVCEATGLSVDLVATETHSEGLVSSLRGRLAEGARVLLVRPEGAQSPLTAALCAVGAHVREAPLYRTVASDRAPGLADDAIAGVYAAVAFTAPSSLDRWLEAAGPRRDVLVAALAGLSRVAIGPTTAAHLEASGLRAHAVSESPDEGSIGDAIARALGVATC